MNQGEVRKGEDKRKKREKEGVRKEKDKKMVRDEIRGENEGWMRKGGKNEEIIKKRERRKG